MSFPNYLYLIRRVPIREFCFRYLYLNPSVDFLVSESRSDSQFTILYILQLGFLVCLNLSLLFVLLSYLE